MYGKSLIVVAVLLLFSAGISAQQPRVRAGLQVLFTFDDDGSEILTDTSGMGRPIQLKVETPSTVKKKAGQLEFQGKSIVRSVKRADKIHRASEWTNEITVETWIEPDNIEQKGPARIVTFSRNGSQRNFTLGQEGDRFDFRLRTNQTSVNGTPSLSSPPKTAKNGLTHVVYTRTRTGNARLFVDGKQVTRGNVPGEFSNWDINFRLLLGNEQTDDRTWKGKIYLVAIYNRALRHSEVLQNFQAGKQGRTPPVSDTVGRDPFKKVIAPLYALHCLECHDSFNRQGGLDLSLEATAMTGESGKLIIPGQASKSILWKLIENDEMPHDRPALKPADKIALRKWIDSGAVWTVDRIDPAIFQRSREVTKNLVRRLTVSEYVRAVKIAVDVDIQEHATRLLPKDLRADGFNNTSYNLGVDLKHIEVYSRLAAEISKQINYQKLVSRFYRGSLKDPGFSDHDLRELIDALALWVLRGPLDDVERRSIQELALNVKAVAGDYMDAVAAAVEAMLQAPRFLYQMEQQRGDGTRWPVDAFTKANRASFMLWGSPPDRELFELAKTGDLLQPEIYEQQIERMLRHPWAVKRSEEFVKQWLNLDRLKDMKPGSGKFPDWRPTLAEQMQEETLRFWTEIVWNRKLPLTSLFDADLAFVTPELARHYGMVGKGRGIEEKQLKKGWNQIDLKQVPGRRGLLTQGSVLTIGGDEASMVTRGLFILNDVLRGVVKDPPPCVDTTPIATRAGLTQREIATGRIGNQSCGGCHVRFEPLAFGFERFDGLGTYREFDEYGNRLREDGKIRIPGEAQESAFGSTKELARLIAGSHRSLETMTWKMTQFLLGRPLNSDDLSQLKLIGQKAKAAGGTYQSLIQAIVTSDLVLEIRTAPYPKEP